MTRILDSSVLMAAFDERDPRQAEAVRVLAQPERIEVPPEVLAETLGVVQRRHGKPSALALHEQLLRIPHLVFLRSSDVEAIATVWAASRQRISWVDAAVVWWCRERRARPLCFDVELAKATS